jgi:hypothetical protein
MNALFYRKIDFCGFLCRPYLIIIIIMVRFLYLNQNVFALMNNGHLRE